LTPEDGDMKIVHLSGEAEAHHALPRVCY